MSSLEGWTVIRGSIGRERKINVTFGEPKFSREPLLSDFNFRLARDQVVHLETAANLSTSRCQANNFFAVCSSLELGGITKVTGLTGNSEFRFSSTFNVPFGGDFLVCLYPRLVTASLLILASSSYARNCARNLFKILHCISWSFREGSLARVVI